MRSVSIKNTDKNIKKIFIEVILLWYLVKNGNSIDMQIYNKYLLLYI